jgi:outer membrane protein TolC
MVMNVRNKMIVSLTVPLVIFIVIASANAISLEEAKKEALTANLKIKIYQEGIHASQSIRKERLTHFFPTFNVVASGIHEHEEPRIRIDKAEYGIYPIIGPVPVKDISVATGEQDTYKISLQLHQQLFAGGRVYYSYQQAKVHEELSGWDMRQAVQDVLLDVEKAYSNVLKAEETKKMIVQHENTIKAHMNDMEVRYEKGSVALNDVLKVKVELARARERVIKAVNDITMAKGALNLVLNKNFNTPVEVVTLDNVSLETASLEEAENLALMNRPSLKSIRAQGEEALFNRLVQKAEYYPNLMLIGEYVRQTEQPHIEEEDYSVGLVLRYPLWDWGRKGHKVGAAMAMERQIDYEKSMLTNQIIAEVNQSWLKVREADERIEVATEAMAQAEENKRITQIGFDKGGLTSTELLDAEDLLSKTYADYIRAKYDARVERVVLRHVMGLLMVEGMAEASE